MQRDQLKKLERDLWSAADKLRANSDLKATGYSTPVLGIIFLKFVDNKYRQHEAAKGSALLDLRKPQACAFSSCFAAVSESKLVERNRMQSATISTK